MLLRPLVLRVLKLVLKLRPLVLRVLVRRLLVALAQGKLQLRR